MFFFCFTRNITDLVFAFKCVVHWWHHHFQNSRFIYIIDEFTNHTFFTVLVNSVYTANKIIPHTYKITRSVDELPAGNGYFPWKNWFRICNAVPYRDYKLMESALSTWKYSCYWDYRCLFIARDWMQWKIIIIQRWL